MTRFGVASRQPSHIGKSGFVRTSPAPKPIPFSLIEEIGSNLYPSARDYIPLNLRGYTDSYYDLRNEKYQYWYDKWGKPHINKWWRNQLDETLRIQKAKESFFSQRKRSNTRPINYRRYSGRRRRNTSCNCQSLYIRRGKRFVKYRSTGQRPNCKCRSQSRNIFPRSSYKSNYGRWRY